MVVTFGGLGLIDATGWQIFFFIVGALVIIMGDLGGVIVEDSGVPTDADIGVFKRVRHTFSAEFSAPAKEFLPDPAGNGPVHDVVQHLFSVHSDLPATLLELPVANVELLVLVSITVGGIVFAIPAGILSDKIGRKKVAIAAILIESIFVILFAFSPQIADALPVFSDQAVTNLTIWPALSLSSGSAPKQRGWLPATPGAKIGILKKKRAEFSGYTTIFQIGVGGGLGALLGGIIANASGTPGIVDGQQAIIPSPTVFIASGIIVLITLIPVYLAQEKDRIAEI